MQKPPSADKEGNWAMQGTLVTNDCPELATGEGEKTDKRMLVSKDAAQRKHQPEQSGSWIKKNHEQAARHGANRHSRGIADMRVIASQGGNRVEY